MKRDMDLVRLILLQIEENTDDPLRSLINLEISDYTSAQVSYHVMLLNDAGLIEADDLSTMGSGSIWRLKRLTWDGHEFLDAARNDSIWNQTKEKAGSMSFEIIKELLLSLGRKQLELQQ